MKNLRRSVAGGLFLALVCLLPLGMRAHDYVVLVDTSLTMSRAISGEDRRVRIQVVQEALRSFISAVPAGTRLWLASFNTGMASTKELVLRSESDRADAGRWVDRLADQKGETYLWTSLDSALRVATDYSSQDPDRTVIVRVLTDGQDTQRVTSLDKVLEKYPLVDGEHIFVNMVKLGGFKLRYAPRPGFEVTENPGWDPPLPPVIRCSPDGPKAGQEVRLLTTEDYREWEWRIDRQLIGEQKELRRTFAKPGKYRVEVRVIGFKGLRDRAFDDLRVEERARAAPLEPDFVFVPGSVEPGQPVVFSGRCSRQPASCSWLVDGRQAGQEMEWKTLFPAEKDYEVVFQVSDEEGKPFQKKRVIRVREMPLEPRFKAPTHVSPGEPVQFANETVGRVASWEWDFGDGTKGPERLERNPIHKFANDTGKPLERQVVLFAKSASGKTYKSEPSLIRVGPGVPPPEAAFEVLGEDFRVGTLVELKNRSTGWIDSSVWEFGGPVKSPQTQPENEKDPAVSYETDGEKTITLTVRGRGGESRTNKTIRVLPRAVEVQIEWLNKHGDISPQPPEIHFGTIKVEHVQKRDFERPAIDTFRIEFPPDKPPAEGIAVAFAGATNVFEVECVAPSPGAASGPITGSGKYRITIETNVSTGSHTATAIFRVLGSTLTLPGGTNQFTIAVKTAISTANDGIPPLVPVLLIAAVIFVCWLLTRDKEDAGSAALPAVMIRVTLSERAAGGGTVGSSRPPGNLRSQVFELSLYESVALGATPGEPPLGKVFDCGAPDIFVMRQPDGLVLGNKRKPESLRKLAPGELREMEGADGTIRKIEIAW